MLPTSYFNNSDLFYFYFLQSRKLKVVECDQWDEDATTTAIYAKSML
jgi:hypothetical protein